MASIPDGVSFGAFELDLVTGELRKSGRLLKLQPQPMRVLCLFVTRPGELIRREEIRRHLWGDSTFVDYEIGLDYCINRIRSVLGDSAQSPQYIETLPRRGYRFIATIKRHRPFLEPTLAVLPFANLNGDASRDYFADGITDALITELARIQSLRVLSRQSILHLKGSSRKLDEIARDLQVDGIVEGAVLHEGNRARMTAQLILMEPERHLWAQSYECDMGALLSAQREAAKSIAECVAAVLKPMDAVTIATPPEAQPIAPEVVESYFLARNELFKMSAEGLGNALRYLRGITVKAPDFASGLAGYAACLGSLGYWGHAPVREVYPGAKQMALRALALDDGLDVAHVVLGMVHWMLDWDLASAEQELLRAIELGPSNSDVYTFRAIFLSHVGRYSEAASQVQYALRLAPASLFPNHAAAWIYLAQGHLTKAEDQARRTLALFPDPIHAYFVLGWSAWRRHRIAEAVAVFEKALSLSREAFSLAFLGHVYGCAGRRDEATGLLRELDRLFANGQAPPVALAMVHAGLGEVDAALEWMETAYRLRDDKLFWLPLIPAFDPLRPDPRFAAFLHRIPLLA